MVPVRAPLSQRSRNIRTKQAPRAPSQVRARELMRTPKFQTLARAVVMLGKTNGTLGPGAARACKIVRMVGANVNAAVASQAQTCAVTAHSS